jgi:hypothetical protein
MRDASKTTATIRPRGSAFNADRRSIAGSTPARRRGVIARSAARGIEHRTTEKMTRVIKVVGSERVTITAQERARQVTARPLGEQMFAIFSAKGVCLVPQRARNAWTWTGSFQSGEIVGALAMVDGIEGEFEITETPWRGIVAGK